jgi:hypothetical protein
MLLTACSEETDFINEDAIKEYIPTEDELDELEERLKDEETTEDVGENQDELDIYANGFKLSTYELVQAFEETSFSQPLQLTYDYEDSPYVYVVEKQGLIKRIDTRDNTMEVFMDLRQTVDASENEKGLLGLAFHPNFPEDPRFFLYYTEQNLSKLVSYEARKADGDNGYVVEAESQKDLFDFSQPYANHNGGHIAFGPDGYLYIASGDGGSAGDPNNNAQNLSNLLGKILRIDVDVTADNQSYRIPEDNPFAGENNAMGEIYAYGLRNPWKFSFDKHRGIMIAADVGQNAIEEINIIENGGNYGWSRFEGTQMYNESVTLEENPIDPIYEYTHSEGQSITGGYTYYGEELLSLFGVYVYGDFMTGTIWGLWIDQDNQVHNETILSTDLRIPSFGLDANNELYIVDFRGGIYQLKEAE